MTRHEEPQIVELDDLLDDEETHDSRVTPIQWALVVVGGVVGIVGLLAVLVATAPIVLDLVTWINKFTSALNSGY